MKKLIIGFILGVFVVGGFEHVSKFLTAQENKEPNPFMNQKQIAHILKKKKTMLAKKTIQEVGSKVAIVDKSSDQ